MKAIIISEAALELARSQLIEKLSKAMREREEKIRTGNVVGMAADPETVANYHVTDVFQKVTLG